MWGLIVFAKPIISARCSFWLIPSKGGFPQYSANTDICNWSGFWFLVERPNCFEWSVPTVLSGASQLFLQDQFHLFQSLLFAHMVQGCLASVIMNHLNWTDIVFTISTV